MSVLENGAYVVDCVTGENILNVPKGWDLKVRSESQVSNDKKYEPCSHINSGRKFIKDMLYGSELAKKYMNVPRVFIALEFIKCKIDYKSNYLVKGDKSPYRIADLARDMCITKQRAGIYVKILREENILAETRHNGLRYLVMNPNYFCVSVEVWDSTIKMF